MPWAYEHSVSLPLPSTQRGQAGRKRVLSVPISRLDFLVSRLCNRVSNHEGVEKLGYVTLNEVKGLLLFTVYHSPDASLRC